MQEYTAYTLNLEVETADMLRVEAAQSGVEESEIVHFALALLAHYRRETDSGDALLLSPPAQQETGLTLHAAAITPYQLVRVLEVLPLDLLTCTMATIDKNAPRHLRVVR